MERRQEYATQPILLRKIRRSLPACVWSKTAEAGRLQLLFDGKPQEEARNALKAAAFKWAPSVGAWQRQLTDNAIRAAKQIISDHFSSVRNTSVQEESAVYTVNEPDPITGDLFQGTENALPAAARRSSLQSKIRRRYRPVRSARHALAVREAPDTEGLYNVQAQLITVGERQLR